MAHSFPAHYHTHNSNMLRKSLFLWILLFDCSHQTTNNNLLMAVNVMKNINPTGNFNLMCQNPPKQAQIVLDFGKMSKTVGFSQISTHKQSVIYCADDYPTRHFKSMFCESCMDAVHEQWVIMGSTSTLNVISDELSLLMHQRVYLLNTDEKVLVERYHIKTVIVNKSIAMFDEQKGSLVWQDEKDFVTRRANYQNIRINTVFFNNEPYTKLNHDTKLKIEKSNNSTIVVALKELNKAEGFNFDVLNLLKDDLNSSLRVYWYRGLGLSPPVRVNGTFVWTGPTATGLLLSGVVDIIVSSTPHTLGQFMIKSFLHALGDLKTALYVNVDAGSYERDWLTFITQFRPHSWVLYVGNSILVAMGLNLIFFFISVRSNCRPSYSFRSILAFIGDLWMVLMSYFGKPASSKFWWVLSPTKIYVVTFCVLVWKLDVDVIQRINQC